MRVKVWRDDLSERRIDSSYLLQRADPLPHVFCYPSDGRRGHHMTAEANQHGDTQGIDRSRWRSAIGEAAGRERTTILEEFVALDRVPPQARHSRPDREHGCKPRPRGAAQRLYDEAVRQALIVLWEAG